MNGTEEDVMYDKVPTDLKFVEREKEVEKFWEAEHIFEKSIKMREAASLCIYDGRQLPTASLISAMWRPV